ncbi:MAG: arginine--tRNA ligase [Candidatus Saccharimonadales bacterium]
MQNIQQSIRELVSQHYGQEIEPIVSRPEPQFGDVSSNVAMQLAKPLQKNPREIAEELAEMLTELDEVKDVSVAGPGFLNITLTDSVLVSMLDTHPMNSDKTVVIETNNPNPFKAMHIGHAYNAIIADTIANLIEREGNHVYRVSYHGDIGAHVGRSMYALLRYIDGDVKKLEEVSTDERNSFMSRMYAEGSRAYKEDEAAKPVIDELAKQSFTRQDPTYAHVYDTIFDWSFEEIALNMARLGNKPVEKKFLESDADARGVQIVRDHTPEVFEESDGALIFRGSDYGGFDNVFVASNGLGLYGARDVGLIALKREQYHPDISYIVTAEEQKAYFKGLLAAAAQIYPGEDGVTVNISHGTVKLSTGKMSSRTGDVIEISWLFDQIVDAMNDRGGTVRDDVAMGALRYAFLKVRVGGDVIFDVNESVSIQGNSGPYLQYAHARACSILAKSTVTIEQPTDCSFQPDERLLLRKVTEYSDVVERATQELMPHHICNYLYELSQEFNRFYEKNRVISDDRESVRLWLVETYRDTLADGLGLLGIPAPKTL